MLSKCANPSCSKKLIYLREGKIFKMEHTARPQLLEGAGAVPAGPSSRFEHFWLCGRCSENLTLVYHRERGVEVVAKPAKPSRRAAAS